ncbi:hypothetical protein GIB67_018073 [Kingdonia uniflora]|uniref:Uncharacterized protein n=1 Tax=Kingdonia uniflora TaxID=39325 RepID=A0A7J7NWL2_9MAGN|nr:hypothetical protein GIB67_018073 [Kingdonia uniflora]
MLSIAILLHGKLHEMESRSPFKDPMDFEDISKLEAKVVILSEELEQKANEMEVMESFCDMFSLSLAGEAQPRKHRREERRLNNPFVKLDAETGVYERGEIDIQNVIEDRSMLTNPHHAVEEFSGVSSVTDRRQLLKYVTAMMVRNLRRLPALYCLVDSPTKSESSFEKGMIPAIEEEAESPKKVVPAVALFGKKGLPMDSL